MPRMHISNGYDGTDCKVAGNWEGCTVDWDVVNCPACLLDKPKTEPTPLYTIIQKSEKTGEEIVLYGHVTENVVAQYACVWVAEGRDVIIRRWVQTEFACDWSNCPGNHPTEKNYCSMATRAGI